MAYTFPKDFWWGAASSAFQIEGGWDEGGKGMTVADFNERQDIVATARQALTIAEDAYAQTLQRFIKGQADAYSLSVAQSHWQTARQNQIASLQNYWLAYYHLRRLTLYDYQRRQTVTR